MIRHSGKLYERSDYCVPEVANTYNMNSAHFNGIASNSASRHLAPLLRPRRRTKVGKTCSDWYVKTAEIKLRIDTIIDNGGLGAAGYRAWPPPALAIVPQCEGSAGCALVSGRTSPLLPRGRMPLAAGAA